MQLTTGLIAWAYVRLGSLPQVAPFLQGIKPAVLAVILAALWRLGKTAVKGWKLGTIPSNWGQRRCAPGRLSSSPWSLLSSAYDGR